jgi:hypothetical protein
MHLGRGVEDRDAWQVLIYSAGPGESVFKGGRRYLYRISFMVILQQSDFYLAEVLSRTSNSVIPLIHKNWLLQ